jgi:hypothetical protein
MIKEKEKVVLVSPFKYKPNKRTPFFRRGA